MVNGESIETFDLPAQGRLIIGRSPSADVMLEHNSVSREHAVLENQFDRSSPSRPREP